MASRQCVLSYVLQDHLSEYSRIYTSLIQCRPQVSKTRIYLWNKYADSLVDMVPSVQITEQYYIVSIVVFPMKALKLSQLGKHVKCFGKQMRKVISLLFSKYHSHPIL